MIIPILVAAFLLRLIGLNQSLWLDESISAMAVKNYDLVGLITRFAPGDVHPPLFYILLKLWTNLFGYSEISLRFPSVIAGVLAVFLVYKIANKLFNQKVSLLASLFMAVNPLAIYYSQEARMYSLVTLFVALSLFAFFSKKWLLFLLSFLAAFYTDYLSWLMFPFFFLTASNKKNFLLSSFLFLLFILPWLPIFQRQFLTGATLAGAVPLWGQTVGGASLKALLLVPIKFIVGRISIDNKRWYFLVFGLLGAVYAWIVARVPVKLLWLWLVVPITLGFLISLVMPIFSYHRLLFVLPAFMLLLALGAEKNKTAVAVVLVTSLVSVAVFILNPSFQREDWRGVVNFMRKNPGIALIPSLAQSSALAYYDPHYPIYDKNNFSLDHQSPVYLFRYVQEIFDPQDQERKLLEASGYKKIDQENFNGIVVWKYVL